MVNLWGPDRARLQARARRASSRSGATRHVARDARRIGSSKYLAHFVRSEIEKWTGADQGKRADRGMSRAVFAGLVRESWYAEFDRRFFRPNFQSRPLIC